MGGKNPQTQFFISLFDWEDPLPGGRRGLPASGEREAGLLWNVFLEDVRTLLLRRPENWILSKGRAGLRGFIIGLTIMN